jgi:hypothetical protein
MTAYRTIEVNGTEVCDVPGRPGAMTFDVRFLKDAKGVAA